MLEQFGYSTKGLTYLNYAATSYPKSKIALEAYFTSITAPPLGERMGYGKEKLIEMKSIISTILKRKNIDSIYFTSGGTLAINQVIKGYLNENDEYVIDNRSHSSVFRIANGTNNNYKRYISELYDIKDRLLPDKLKEIIDLKPKLVCLSHASNVTGAIYPVECIIDQIKKHSPNTAVFVDASQTAGAVSLSSLQQADFIVFPSHKHLHSVPGAALIVTDHELKPLIEGGTGLGSNNESSLPKGQLFAEVGTANQAAIEAMVASLIYAEEHLKEHSEHELTLYELLIDGLEKIPEIKILGDIDLSKIHMPVIACETLIGNPEVDWVPFLLSQKIIVRGGLHCSPLHHAQLKLSDSGSLRFSFGWHTKKEEINHLLQALKEFAYVMKGISCV